MTDCKTIEELKEWYSARNLPPYEITRFFIGENRRDAKCFGIYQDETSGEFVVYKNKADGSRAVRYQGSDEAYAVHEFQEKLKSEIINQKQNNKNVHTYAYINGERIERDGSSSRRSSKFSLATPQGRSRLFSAATLALIIGFSIAGILNSTKSGYYRYNDTDYYCYDDYWYYYDAYYDDWFYTDEPYSDMDDYYYGDTSYSGESILNASNYDTWRDDWDSSDSSYSSDSDYDWSSSDDSWDSGSSDWDSDW